MFLVVCVTTRVLDPTRSEKNDANDARSVAIVALHQAGFRRVTAADHVAMLAGRHKQLSGLKTQAASSFEIDEAEVIYYGQCPVCLISTPVPAPG